MANENKFTAEMIEKAKAAKSAEELLTLAKENGVDLGKEEALEAFAKLNKSGEISDDELDNVAGGGCDGDEELAYQRSFSDAYNAGQPCPVCGVGSITKTRNRGRNFQSSNHYQCNSCGAFCNYLH